MAYLIGTDEAGYGPNLGPLVVSASVWQVPEGINGDDLYERLKMVIVPTAEAVAENPTARVAVADSKILYRPGKGLRHLERGLWAAMGVLGHQPETWQEVWAALAAEAARDLRSIPWYSDFDIAIPLDADRSELEPLGAALCRGLAEVGIRLLSLRSRAVFPGEFNELVDRYGSKGTVLSHITLGLISQVMMPLGEGSISVVCDKHGGRNRYGGLLSEHFPQWLIKIYGESRSQSMYGFGPADRRVEFFFRAKGEGCLAAGLASMASKYLRELAMRALNDYWCRQVSALRPTAGYPQDAKRYRAEIGPMVSVLGIAERMVWRTR